jgi:hypothetical protein
VREGMGLIRGTLKDCEKDQHPDIPAQHMNEP